jgi:hypothetical protein
MPDLVKRTRTISLRLSHAEYEALKAQYRSRGARNISDFARLAIQRIMLAASEPSPEIGLRVANLEQRVHALETEMSSVLARAHSDGQ